MTILKTVVIDDDPIAVGLVQSIAQKYVPDIDIQHVYNDPVEALKYLASIDPDLILLDITMPTVTGMEVIDIIPPEMKDRVIFVTGHEQFAIEAFRKGAHDYLLKPVSPESLKDAVVRYKTKWKKQAADSASPQKYVIVNRHDKAVLLDVDDIGYMEADGSYTKIRCVDQRIITSSKPLTYFRELLSGTPEFVLPYNACLINIKNIIEILKEEEGDGRVLMKGGLIVDLSRIAKNRLIEIIKDRL